MGEVLAIQSIGVEQGANQRAIDIPFDVFGCPIDGIGVPSVLRIVDCFVSCAVVGRCVAFTEIVRLDDGCVATEPFLEPMSVCYSGTIRGYTNPVNLVKIIRLHDEAGDNSSSVGGFQGDLSLAEEDIVVGDYGACETFRGHDEFSTICAISDRGA